MDCYPEAERKSYSGLQACYDAVAGGKADCLLVSNYRISSEEEALKKNKLFTVPTGESLKFSFAVRKSDCELYSIMSKTVLTTKTSEMDAALASYIVEEQDGQRLVVGVNDIDAQVRQEEEYGRRLAQALRAGYVSGYHRSGEHTA